MIVKQSQRLLANAITMQGILCSVLPCIFNLLTARL